MRTQASGTDVTVRLVIAMRLLNPTVSEDELNNHATSLQIANSLSVHHNLPRRQETGGGRAKEELKQVSKNALALAQELLHLHSEALRAFEQIDPLGRVHPMMLKDDLALFTELAKCAAEFTPNTPSHIGRNPDVRAGEVTKVACKVYEQLTSQRVARWTKAYQDGKAYGSLHHFLSDVFIILGVNATADSQLKLYLASLSMERKA